MNSLSSAHWTKPGASEIKIAILTRCTEIGRDFGQKEKMRYILRNFDALRKSNAGVDQLRCVIYSITALHQHAKFGGLSSKRIDTIFNAGAKVLINRGVTNKTSRLAYLYGELLLAKSQVSKTEGRQSRSLWELELAYQLTKPTKAMSEHRHSFAVAHRIIRKGHLESGIQLLKRATSGKLTDNEWINANLLLLRCFRLRRRKFEFDALKIALLSSRFGEELKVDIDWETTLYHYSITSDIRSLVYLCRGKSLFSQPNYQIEAWFLALAHQSEDIHTRLPKIRTLLGHQLKRGHFRSRWEKVALAFEATIESRDTFADKVLAIGKILEQDSYLKTIDKELMLWAAATRFFAASSSTSFAAVCLQKYVDLSWTVSSGATRDVLGCMSDLIGRKWNLTSPLASKAI